jgi:hypothetical protein
MYELEHLLMSLVTALVASETVALIPDLYVTRIEPDLDCLAHLNRNRIQVGSHSYAAQPIHSRERKFGKLEAMLGGRQQMRVFFDHQRAHLATLSRDQAPLVLMAGREQLRVEVGEIARLRYRHPVVAPEVPGLALDAAFFRAPRRASRTHC